MQDIQRELEEMTDDEGDLQDEAARDVWKVKRLIKVGFKSIGIRGQGKAASYRKNCQGKSALLVKHFEHFSIHSKAYFASFAY